MTPFNAVIRCVCWLLLTLLGGCATATISLGDPNARIPADAGFVAVQVVSNAESLGGPLRQWNSVFIIEDRVGAEPHFLPSLESADASTSVFVGALPPGRYRLIVLQAFLKTDDFTYRTRARIPPYIGRFEIRSGHLTDLKTLIAQPLLPQTASTERQFKFVVSRDDRSDDLAHYVQRRFPDRYSMLAAERLSWTEDQFQEMRVALRKLIVEHGLPRRSLLLRADQRYDLLNYGRLGRFYLRDRQRREWRDFTLDRPLEIYAAAEAREGFYLGGERGKLFHFHSASGRIRELPSPEPDGLIWNLAMQGNTLILTVQTQGHWTWHASDDEGRQWRVEHREAREKPGILFSVNAPGQVFTARGDLRIWIEKKRLTRSPDGRWTVAAEGREWAQLTAQPNGILVGMPYDWWSGVGHTHISRDQGETWVSTQSGRWGAWGARPGKPYIFADDSVLLPGPAVEYSWFEWKPLERVAIRRLYSATEADDAYGEVGFGCDRLQGEISTDAEIFVLCKFGQLYVSRDQGRSFQLEFDPSLGEREADALILEHLQKLGLAKPATEGE